MRTDPVIDFNWGSGSPDPLIGPNTFSVRWLGYFDFTPNSYCTFTIRSDDGMRVSLHGSTGKRIVVQDWSLHSPRTKTRTNAPIYSDQGENVLVEVEYFENFGGAVAQVPTWTCVPASGSD